MILLNCLGSSMSVYFFWSFRGQYRVIYMTPEFCSGNLELLQDLDRTVGKLEVRLGELPGSLNWSLCLSLFGNWILLTYFLVRVVTPFIPIHRTRWKKNRMSLSETIRLCVTIQEIQQITSEILTGDWLSSSEWEKVLLELTWGFELCEGCWMNGA